MVSSMVHAIGTSSSNSFSRSNKKAATAIGHLGKAKSVSLTGKAKYKSGKTTDNVELSPVSAAVFKIK